MKTHRLTELIAELVDEFSGQRTLNASDKKEQNETNETNLNSD